MDKEKEEISIEDLIEKERGTLDTAKLTKGITKLQQINEISP